MPSSVTSGNRTVVRGLGEIALRVNNLDTMQKFYEKVIGLPLMSRVPNCAFFKIADATAGTLKCSPYSTVRKRLVTAEAAITSTIRCQD